MTTTKTTRNTNTEALNVAFELQRKAALAGFDDILDKTEACLADFQNQNRKGLRAAFGTVHDLAFLADARVRKLAESVGCKDLDTEAFKPEAPTKKAMKVQERINLTHIHAKWALSKIAGVASLAGIALQSADLLTAAKGLESALYTIRDTARGAVDLVESVG